MSRNLTPTNQKESDKLKAIWLAKKIELGMTQIELAVALNTTQGFVSQCLNGHIALSTDMILSFSKVLNFAPGDVRPSIFQGLPVIRTKTVTIESSTQSGNYTPIMTTVHEVTETVNELFGIEAGDEFEPRVRKGEYLILARIAPKEGDEVLIRLASGKFLLADVQTVNNKSYRVKTETGLLTIPAANIKMIHPVHSIQKP